MHLYLLTILKSYKKLSIIILFLFILNIASIVGFYRFNDYFKTVFSYDYQKIELNKIVNQAISGSRILLNSKCYDCLQPVWAAHYSSHKLIFINPQSPIIGFNEVDKAKKLIGRKLIFLTGELDLIVQLDENIFYYSGLLTHLNFKGARAVVISNEIPIQVELIPINYFYILVLWLCFFNIGYLFLTYFVKKIVDDDITLIANNMQLIIKNGCTDHLPSSKIDKVKPITATFNKLINILQDNYERLDSIVSKKTQDISRNQRLEVLGRMSSGLAHEFNNLLTPIVGFASILVNKKTLNVDDMNSVRAILNTSLKAADLVKQLLSYSRKTPKKLGEYRIIDVIEEGYSLSKVTTQGVIDIKLVIDMKLLRRYFVVDRTQISQVIVNLVLNSLYAVQSSNKEIKIICISCCILNDELKIQVYDNGTGIASGLKTKIFDPFFSTKPVGKGTGMGLSVVDGIIKDHGGRLGLESNEEEYTKICCYIPITDKVRKNNLGFRSNGEKFCVSENILVVTDNRNYFHSLYTKNKNFCICNKVTFMSPYDFIHLMLFEVYKYIVVDILSLAIIKSILKKVPPDTGNHLTYIIVKKVSTDKYDELISSYPVFIAKKEENVFDILVDKEREFYELDNLI